MLNTPLPHPADSAAGDSMPSPMGWPSLSVIIPSYNQGRYIERTLLSILRQGYPGPLQVIVSDGGSTDGTVEVLRRYPQVRWWSERDRGFVDAVTRGLAAADGEVVAIQSSDDYYLRGAFVRAVAVLRGDAGLDFVTGNEVRIDEDGRYSYPPLKPYVTLLGPAALIGRTPAMYIPQQCTFVRRSAVDRVGGLREDVDMCADLDLWYRLLHFGRGVLLPDHLAVYQVHATQRTQKGADVWIEAHRKMVEGAERDPALAARFLPTPEMKRHIFLQWEIGWNRQAGGEEGLHKSLSLAREALQREDDWPDYVLDFLRAYSHEPPPHEPPPAEALPAETPRARRIARALLRRIKQNPAVRAVFGKGPIPRQEPQDEQEPRNGPEGIDPEWWREEDASAPSVSGRGVD